MLSPFRQKMRAVLEIYQGPELFCCHDNNVSAVTAVSAVRAAFRDILFPAEADAAIATISTLDKKFGLINESHFQYLSFELVNNTAMQKEIADS
jgi:hypothetical protein